MIKYTKSNGIISNNYEYITFDKVEYKTNIRKIHNSLLITVPKDMVNEFKLKVGSPLFIILEYKNMIKKFITCLSHGSYVFLANIPNYKEHGLIGKEEISIRILFNQRIKKITNYGNLVDMTNLDLSKINYFIEKDRVYLHYKSSNTKKGNVINRFFAIQ